MDLKKFFNDENCFKLIKDPRLWHPSDIPEFYAYYVTDYINGIFSTQELFNLSKKHIDKYKEKLKGQAIDCFDIPLEFFSFDFGVNILKNGKWNKIKIYTFYYTPFAYDIEEEHFHTNFIVSGKFNLFFIVNTEYEIE